MPSDKNKETVTLKRSNALLGDRGDKVKVFDWQKRQLIASGYVDGDDIETVPPAQVEFYREAMKGPEKRQDMDVFSTEKAAREGDGFGSPDEDQDQSEPETKSR